MIGGPPTYGAGTDARVEGHSRWRPAAPNVGEVWGRRDVVALALLLGVAVLIWVPRGHGPIDLRWDGAVYYILGTSLADGRGYRLLNEPGEIAAVQYPPLLPAIVAVHQLALGTSDPTIVGTWLRLSSFALFLAFAGVSFRFFRDHLPRGPAVLGTLLSLFCLHAWFLSDALFPEIWFTVATLLCLVFLQREGRRAAGVAYLAAVAAYALRTIGLAALAVWVLDSALRRHFRQALLRALLAAVPVLLWQGYVWSVERSDAYTQPAYAYQRAPYLFYNVSYARNIALRDPFTPEKGEVRPLRRIVRNALDLPVPLGETLSASRGYLEMGLHAWLGDGPIIRPIIAWGVFLTLGAFGALMVGGGALVRLAHRSPKGEGGPGYLVPLYVLAYLGALCLTPFPAQFLRYVMPVTPMAALLALVLLTAIAQGGLPTDTRGWVRRHLPYVVLGPALLLQLTVMVAVYAREYLRIEYVDLRGEPLSYRLFYYDERQEGYDRAIDYVRAQAAGDDVVAAGMPHWIHLRTTRKTVMPPFESDPSTAQALLDSVPVRFLIVGQDVIASERYTRPVVQQFAPQWERVHVTPMGGWEVYRRRGDEGSR